MKRILFVTSSGERGGAEMILRSILTHLDRRKFSPRVVSLQEGPFLSELRQSASVDVDVVVPGRHRDFSARRRAIHRLERIIRDHSMGLVHCNGTASHVVGSVAARRAGIPSVFHVHDVLGTSWNRQGLLHWFARHVHSTVTVAVSHYVARRLGARANVRVIQNGIELPPPASSPAKTAWGWDADAPVVVWCGRLLRSKGTHVFLGAATFVRRAIPRARFLVVGAPVSTVDHAYEATLRRLAHSFSLDECLRFTGWQENPLGILALADVVVTSSIRPEGFGLVALEGMMLGKPVVAAADGGALEMIRTGETGLLTPPGDAGSLAEALVLLLRDPSMRSRLGEAAREHARAEFGLPRMMRQWESLYDELPTSPSRPFPGSRGLGTRRPPVSAESS